GAVGKIGAIVVLRIRIKIIVHVYAVYVIPFYKILYYRGGLILHSFQSRVHPPVILFQVHYQFGMFFDDGLIAYLLAVSVVRPVRIQPYMQFETAIMRFLYPEFQRIIKW